MGKMWKYEPEEPEDGKKHLKGQQFGGYQTPTTIDYESDNDGRAIMPEPQESTYQRIKREKGSQKRSKADL